MFACFSPQLRLACHAWPQEECRARMARLARDVGSATAEAGQCRVRLAKVAADVEGCVQVRAPVACGVLHP